MPINFISIFTFGTSSNNFFLSSEAFSLDLLVLQSKVFLMLAIHSSKLLLGLNRKLLPRITSPFICFKFATNPKFKVVQDPKEANKLVFQDNGKCRIFQHKNGEGEMKWIMRVGSFFTVFNSFLTGMEMSYPIFGAWNMFSFSVCAGLGYLFLAAFHTLGKRTVHSIDLNINLETVDITFFNPFWKAQVITFHITQFQEPTPSFLGFLRFELTSIGKIWIKLSKNQFRNVKDYEETLDCVLLGKPIHNVNAIPKSKKNQF